MKKFLVYGKANCPWCEKATGLLDSLGHPTDYINLTDHPAKRQDLMDQGHRTVPVVYHGQTLVGGYEALVEYLYGLANG